MTEKEVKLIVGALLHDLGKVIHRTGVNINHSESGYQYLKEELDWTDKEVLETVRYHHKGNLKNAKLEEDSFAYITYIADNIASAADRRETTEKEDKGFEKTFPLQPVFNILNGKSEKTLYYAPKMLNENEDKQAYENMNFPIEEKKPFEKYFYDRVLDEIKDCLKGIDWKDARYINSLLSVLGATMFYVPSSTNKEEVADVSLYDHVKITAAVSSCIYQYLLEKGENNFKKCLFEEEKAFWNEKSFLFYSMDISGIQSFIYDISSEKALKQLRARSFFVQFMTEHMVDMLLEELQLSRANLIYCGGGHCYMLLPNTKAVKERIRAFEREMNQWFLRKFDISIYLACGYEEVCANTLQNEPRNSYSDMFRSVSAKISAKKMQRYQADDIRFLNGQMHPVGKYECHVCKRITDKNQMIENDTTVSICEMCSRLEQLGEKIMLEGADFFCVLSENDSKNEGVPLPGKEGSSLVLVVKNEMQTKKLLQDGKIVRVYAKNKAYTGVNMATTIYVGDYSAKECKTFGDYAKVETMTINGKNGSEKLGIERIGVMRGDVDNLGLTFMAGFEKAAQDTECGKNYNTLSRTATLSRHLSLFFQYYINAILKENNRKVVIVYSGGDDIFIVGGWNEVIHASMDIQQALKKYTMGKLNISAGIGIYPAAYPIKRIASEVGELENASKDYPGKNAVTVFSTGRKVFIDRNTLFPNHSSQTDNKDKAYIDIGTFSWQDFIEKVQGEKLELLKNFFEKQEEKGMSCMYRLLELVRKQFKENGKTKGVNVARLVYMLARLEPVKGEKDDNEYELEKKAYEPFRNKIYKWCVEEIHEKNDKGLNSTRQLMTAMTWYSYLIRRRGN